MKKATLLFSLLCSLLTLIACSSNSGRTGGQLSQKEFSARYRDSLTARVKQALFTLVSDSTIVSKYGDDSVWISTGNAYKQYMGEPDSVGPILKRYVSVSAGLFSVREALQADKIIPVIKPLSYIEGMEQAGREVGAKTGFDGLWEPYNQDLVIAYAQDNPSSIRYITPDDLKTLHVARDTLRRLAVRNLERILPKIELHGESGYYMLTCGGDYEACLILLQDLFTKETMPVTGDYVIAIPNRDLLLITGSKDKAGLTKIRSVVSESYASGSYPISDQLYRWNGKQFGPFD